jgi:glycerophosphoryl diester phosphodiesterase
MKSRQWDVFFSGFEIDNEIKCVKTECRKAIERGVTKFSLPVQMSGDGDLFVFPCELVDKITQKSGFFRYFPSEEIVSIRNEEKRIYDIVSVLRFLSDEGVVSNPGFELNFVIHDKNALNPLVNFLKKFIRESDVRPPQLMISSADQELVKNIESKMPALKRCVILRGKPIDYAACITRCNAQAVMLNAEFLDDALVRDAKSRGAYVILTDAEYPAMIEKFIDAGSDAVLLSEQKISIFS